MSQTTLGALVDIQRGVSICAVSHEEILDEIADWLASQHDNLVAALFAPVITGD